MQHWARVDTEGAAEHYFEATAARPAATPVVNGASLDIDVIEIEGTVFHAGYCAEDIAMVRNQGSMVDDDNKPAPENVSVPGVAKVNNAYK